MAVSRSLAARGAGLPAAREGLRRAEVERSLEQLAYLMDGLLRVPGTGWRIGLDAIVGLIPGVGDFATTAVSLYILAAGVRYRVPRSEERRVGEEWGAG